MRDKKLPGILQHYNDTAYHFLPQNSLAHARNYLLDKIDEELIAYVDADVVLDKDWATHCLKEVAGFGVACVGCSIDYRGSDLVSRIKQKILQSSHRDSNTLEAVEGMGHLNMSAILVKRELLQKAGPFDGSRHTESFEFTYKMLFSGNHLASSTKARATVVGKEKMTTYLVKQLAMGYFLARTLLKYNINPRALFACSHTQANIIAWPGKVIALVGFVIGRLRFCFTANETPTPYYRQLLSDDDLYTLHPLLSICLRKNDVLVVNIKSWSSWSIGNYQGELIAKAIRTKVFVKQLMAAFIANGMFQRIDLEGKIS